MRLIHARGALWGAGPIVLALVLAAATAAPGRAGIVFQSGHHPQPGEENISFSGSPSGSSINGTTSTSNLNVNFSSTTDTLNGSGQNARASDSFINNVTVSVPHGHFWDLIIDLFEGRGSATVTVVTNEAGGGHLTFTDTISLHRRFNILTIFANSPGETISKVTIDAPSGFETLRETKISGAALNPVPEPASMTLAGMGVAGLLGLAWRRRRKPAV